MPIFTSYANAEKRVQTGTNRRETNLSSSRTTTRSNWGVSTYSAKQNTREQSLLYVYAQQCSSKGVGVKASSRGGTVKHYIYIYTYDNGDDGSGARPSQEQYSSSSSRELAASQKCEALC